jgi:tRNA U55 pseudouridine synthase TruB
MSSFERMFPVTLEAVEIEIFSIDRCAAKLTRSTSGCSAAPEPTMRSIAHDLGQRIGCGALLARLRRNPIGVVLNRARSYFGSFAKAIK